MAGITGSYPPLHFPVNSTVDILRGDFIGSYNLKGDFFFNFRRNLLLLSSGTVSSIRVVDEVTVKELRLLHVRLSKIPVDSSWSDVPNLCKHSL